MLKAVTFDSWQVQDRCVVDTSYCGRPSALKQITDLTKNASSSNLANVILSACEVGTSDSTLTFTKEVERSGAPTLTNDDIFG